MSRGCCAALAVLVASASWDAAIHAADPPRRKPLDPSQRAALTALLNAVDAAQQRDAPDDPTLADVGWDNDMLKSQDRVAYVPFRLTLPGGEAAKAIKAAA